MIGQNSSNGGTSDGQLGQTNAIFSDAGITVGGRKYNGTLKFNPAFTAPVALFRNRAGTGRQSSWIIGDQSAQNSGSTTAVGAMDFTGGTVDAQVSAAIVGRGANSPGTGTGTATLTFNAGTIDASALDIGVSGGGVGTGTVNVNGSGLLVANTLLRLGVGASASGTLNINGGTVRANAIANGGGSTANIALTGGTLVLTNNAGTLAAPILNLFAADSTLELAVTASSTNVFVTSLALGSSTNNTISILSLPIITGYPTQYPLISYGSGSSDFLLGSLPSPYQGYISNNLTTSTIDLVVTNGSIPPRALAWGGSVNGDWNTSTANWQGSKTYNQNDFVLFDDTASGTTSVNLTTSLTPGSLTISNLTKSYYFGGLGSLDGAIVLTKDGTGTLTLANSGINTFSGGVSILGGTLQISGSADRLPTNSAVTLADVSGARLDLNNLNQTVQSLDGAGTSSEVKLGSGTLAVWNGGTYGGLISGSGRLIKTNFVAGGTLTLTNANTYSGGTVIGGFTNNTTLAVANQTGSGTGSGSLRVLTNGTFSFGAGGPGGSVAAGVITNDGIVRLNRSDDFTFTNLIVGAGSLALQNSNTVTITSANPYTGGTTINPGILRISNPGALGSGAITVANGAPAVLQLTNGITLTNTLVLASKPTSSGVVPNVENISGSNTMAGPILLTANGSIGWVFFAPDGHLLISGSVLPLSPSQTSQTTTRTLWLRGDAMGEWSGIVRDTVSSTINLALRKDGLGTWILSGANTYTGPTVVSNGTLLVNGVISGGSVTVNGGTLGGNGQISVPVVVNSGGTLSPGASIGKLTVYSSLTFNAGSTNVMELSKSGTLVTNDQISVLTTLTLGGTLNVTLSGTVTGGEVFQLFTAGTFSGTSFDTINLPALPGTLTWDTSKLAVNGTLSVAGGSQPTLSLAQSGNVLTFSWLEAGFKLQAQTNSAGISTNWSDYPGGGTSPVPVTINPANPSVFFRLISQ